MIKHSRSGRTRRTRLSLPSIRVSAPNSAVASPRSSTNAHRTSIDDIVGAERTGKEGLSSSTSRAVGKASVPERYASLFSSTASDVPAAEQHAPELEPILPPELRQAVETSIESCASYEEQCRHLQESIQRKAAIWRKLLAQYEAQDQDATAIDGNLSSSVQELEAAMDEIGTLIKQAHDIRGKLPPVEEFLVEVDRDVEVAKTQLGKLEESLDIEQIATATRKASNEMRRFWTGLVYILFTLGIATLFTYGIMVKTNLPQYARHLAALAFPYLSGVGPLSKAS